MNYSIYVLLGLTYSLMGIIVFFVVRLMKRESRGARSEEAPRSQST